MTSKKAKQPELNLAEIGLLSVCVVVVVVVVEVVVVVVVVVGRVII